MSEFLAFQGSCPCTLNIPSQNSFKFAFIDHFLILFCSCYEVFVHHVFVKNTICTNPFVIDAFLFFAGKNPCLEGICISRIFS
jgi:hypothetical protein